MTDSADKKTQEPTALPLVKAEILRFLASDKPEVLCIRGKWGVGKTYTWETILKEAQQAKRVALGSYSYVSLFGLDSLAGFKTSIFENVIPMKSVGTDPTIATLAANVKGVAKLAASAWKPGLGALAEHAAFLSVTEYIVCIDDLERKGDKLRIIDVLGLVSLLRERRKCKIVLILNEKELGDDEDNFERFSEKVIDSSLVYEPTPAEAAGIALTGPDDHEKLLAERCTQLGISNIRILKKIERLVLIVAPELKEFDSRVLQQAVSSLALLGWCVYGKQTELLDYAINKRYQSRFGLNKDNNEREKGFDDFLEGYGFGFMDPLDKVLLDGINTGFFDFSKLKKEAKEIEAGYKNQVTKELLDRPWSLYRDSFDDNKDEFIAGLVDVFEKQMSAVNLSYLDSGVTLLKRFGKDKEAAKAIDDYIKANDAMPQSEFNVTNMSFPPQDPDIHAALKRKFESFEDKRDPAAVLIDIVKNSGWNDEDLVLLSKLSPDDFYGMFKTLRGPDLRRVAKRAIDFVALNPSDKQSMAVGKNAYLALKKLSDENPYNAERVRNLYNLGAVERALEAHALREKAAEAAVGRQAEEQTGGAHDDQPPGGAA